MTTTLEEVIADSEIVVIPPLPMDQYLKASERTTSGSFHEHLVSDAALRIALEYRIGVMPYIDGMKKTLFYARKANGALSHLQNTVPPGESDSVTFSDIDMLHSILGVDSEAGELIQLLHHHLITGQPIDSDELINEAGDVLWYLALLFRRLGTTFEEVAAKNIHKLQLRYPDKFTEVTSQGWVKLLQIVQSIAPVRSGRTSRTVLPRAMQG